MKRLSIHLLAGIGLALSVAMAHAQDAFPSKPIKIIVPYAPGGATDIVARTLGDTMRQVVGQQIVVENKPGAFGIIAIEEMARAKPDGYTLMIGNVTTNAITPILYPKKFKINYDKDVVNVTRLVDVPAFLTVTTTNFAPRTIKELVAYAKANPDKVRYGTVGVGSYPHFDGALFAKRAGISMVHIPNKAGASGVIKDMIAGDIQVAFLNVASTAAMVKSGKLVPLALVNDKRLPEYPNVPTMAEAGFPGVGTLAWQGLFAPAGTPQPVLAKIFDAVQKSMQAEALAARFAKTNFRLVPNKSADEAKSWLVEEIANWRKVAAEAKIQIAE